MPAAAREAALRTVGIHVVLAAATTIIETVEKETSHVYNEKDTAGSQGLDGQAPY